MVTDCHSNNYNATGTIYFNLNFTFTIITSHATKSRRSSAHAMQGSRLLSSDAHTTTSVQLTSNIPTISATNRPIYKAVYIIILSVDEKSKSALEKLYTMLTKKLALSIMYTRITANIM